MHPAPKIVIINPANWLDSEAILTALASGHLNLMNETMDKPLKTETANQKDKEETTGSGEISRKSKISDNQ